MKLLFIRHAESTGNREGRMQGQGEFELTDWGQVQAKLLGQRLRQSHGWPSHLYSSPAQRARQTVAIILEELAGAALPHTFQDWAKADPHSLPPVTLINEPNSSMSLTVEAALHEFQNGIFQGLTWAEAQQLYPDFCVQLEASLDWIPIPGAETLQAGRDRAHQFIQTLLSQHQHDDHIWVVSHSWILQHLISALLGCDRAWGMVIPNTALFEFHLDRDRWDRSDHSRLNTDLWQIRHFNDIQHLLVSAHSKAPAST